ncbi:hypothetical protein QFC19_001641 [Naganishia cerealis]|uniref:Uncharacterized protein n=1 Tax=Naganishia cerealis TaxID=610337 RepID=A0ACC2WFQ7_9TREE|nr:hypothetical protein QFC19_001641 [Naganishia cerealis]
MTEALTHQELIMSSPLAALSGLKKNEHALDSCEFRLYSAGDDKSLQNRIKASPTKEGVKEQRRALLAAKTEASLKEAFRQVQVRRERQNKQRGSNK